MLSLSANVVVYRIYSLPEKTMHHLSLFVVVDTYLIDGVQLVIQVACCMS